MCFRPASSCQAKGLLHEGPLLGSHGHQLYCCLQIHYGVDRPDDDSTSGMVLNLTEAHVPFSAGMLMYASTFIIPAKAPEHLVPNKCCYSGFEPAHGFAYRVHTHILGR